MLLSNACGVKTLIQIKLIEIFVGIFKNITKNHSRPKLESTKMASSFIDDVTRSFIRAARVDPLYVHILADVEITGHMWPGEGKKLTWYMSFFS